MQKRITKNLTLKILAFLIAVFLWLIVVNIDDPVDDKTFSNIPVQVTHEEVITDNNNTYQIVDNTQEVNVTVTAQRSVLDKIKAEDIQATEEEINKKLEEYAKYYNRELEEIKAAMANSRSYLEDEVKFDNTIQFLYEHAVKTEKKEEAPAEEASAEKEEQEA